MNIFLQILIAVLLLAGATLMALAGIGILRLPDLFLRMHASSKGPSLGVACMLIAAAFYFQNITVTTKVTLTTAFIFLTIPVAAHMLSRAAYARNIPQWKNSVLDEGKGKIAAPTENTHNKA